MNITDIQECADFYKKTYIETFYIVTTFNGNSFILIGEKKNFPHLMGIAKKVYKSNGYANPAKLYADIIDRKSISSRIIPNNIAVNSKMYNKVINFQNSVDIFWRNSGPLAINYNEALSTSKLSSVSMLLTDIKSGYMTGWVESTELPINGEIKLKRYCISSWIDESGGSEKQREKYMPNQDIDIIKSVLAFDKNSDLVREKTYNYTEAQKKEILKAIERGKSNLLIDSRNFGYYERIAITEKIHCKINGTQY